MRASSDVPVELVPHVADPKCRGGTAIRIALTVVVCEQFRPSPEVVGEDVVLLQTILGNVAMTLRCVGDVVRDGDAVRLVNDIAPLVALCDDIPGDGGGGIS